MLLTGGGLEGDGYVDLSFNVPEHWTFKAQRIAEITEPDNTTFIKIGDAERGPAIDCHLNLPGTIKSVYPAHGHASDNFRVAVRGGFDMGSVHYSTGEFRFQQGWKPYASDTLAYGPDGGWLVNMFADRRGTRMRPVKAVPEPSAEIAAAVAAVYQWDHSTGDALSDDPTKAAGPAALVSTMHGSSRAPHLDGSYAASESWTSVDHSRTVTALLGDRLCGPVLVLCDTDAGRMSAPGGLKFETELLRIIVGGSGRIGEKTYVAGDMRCQYVDASADEVIAGPDGLREMIIIGDRRGAIPSVKGPGWTNAIASTLSALTSALP